MPPAIPAPVVTVPGPQVRETAPPPPPRPSADERPAGEELHDRRVHADRSIRVNVETLDALGLLAGDLLVESARAGLRGGEGARIFERFSRLGDALVRLGEKHSQAPELRSRIVQLENDLHLLRDDAFRFVRTHADGLNSLHGNLNQLADHVADARLVPLASVFEAFPRAVRELALSQAKQIELSIENSGAGVDRQMVADVRDALVHLIRNAVDHGVESPDLRSTLGKPEAGHITIRARADGDMLQGGGRGRRPGHRPHAAEGRRAAPRAW